MLEPSYYSGCINESAGESHTIMVTLRVHQWEPHNFCEIIFVSLWTDNSHNWKSFKSHTTENMAYSKRQIGFTFSNMSLIDNIFSDSDIGRGVSDKDGSLTKPMFRLAGTSLVDYNKAYSLVEEEFEILKKISKTTKLLKIDGWNNL